MKKKAESQNFFIKYHYLFLIIIFCLFLYLRYFHIDVVGGTGFDQSRDAFQARNILHGHFTFQGPWTGNGHIHIGPLYFYLLAGFFYLFNLDPIASHYLNMLFNIFNFIAIYIVIFKLFKSRNAALFGVIFYSFTDYFIRMSQTAWNVSPMIGIAAFIFYAIIKIYEGQYKWFFWLATLSGLYFHAHFTAIFLPPIILLSLVFLKDKRAALKYGLLSLPLYFVWFIPNIVGELMNQNGDAGRYKEFVQYFYHGFHARFLLFRLTYNFVLFNRIFPIIGMISQIVLPLTYAITVLFFEKDKREKLIAYIIGIFFLVPLIGFTLYSGTISEYYFLHTTVAIIYILIYLQKKLLSINFKVFIVILSIFWITMFYIQTGKHWIKPTEGGLKQSKETTRKTILDGGNIPFEEGVMSSYLYTIWKEDGKRF